MNVPPGTLISQVLVRRAVRTAGGAKAAYSELNDSNTVFQYVGRPSLLGNPFRAGKLRDKAEAVALYRAYLKNPPAPVADALARLQALVHKGTRVVLLCPCYTHGEPCHAEVLRDALVGTT